MMKRASGVFLILLLMSVACESGDKGGPVEGRASAAPPTITDSPAPAILGEWRSDYTCRGMVRAYERAGIGEAALEWLVNAHMVKGPADRLAESSNPCEGAEDIQRTYVFRPNGYLLDYRGSKLESDCRCYELIGDESFVVLGDSGDPDITLHYVVDGNRLRFDAQLPSPCSTTNCRDQFAFAVFAYAIGPWERVD